MDAASMETMNMTYLPLSNPLCNNDTCLAFETAHLASQAQISWLSQFEYGKWVTYYYCGFIGIFAIHYIYRTITDRIVHNRPKDVRRTPTLMDRKIALGRSLTYRRLSGRIGDSLGLPSLGLTAFILLSILFALLLTFVQHPYYRLRRGFGSPPLGVRAGMAGTALTPLVFALAGKYNLVTLLTGISHEKLNTLHRWVSYIYLFFGIAHTVPFLVADLSDGGTKRLHYQFYYDGSMEYTGIAPFVVLLFLSAFSAYWFRRRFYWLFAKTHIIASIAFLGTMFWHLENTMDSWYYLWGTVAVMLIQWTARAFGKTTIFEMSGRNGGWERAGELQVDILDPGMARLRMNVAMRWKPGQHVFLRIPEFGMLANHPFTITSTCLDKVETKNEVPDLLNEMTFLVRPYGGITKRLLQHNGPAPYAMIDGPYGGIQRPLQLIYDNIVLVGGGGGVSALLPWLEDLSLRMSEDPTAVRLSHLTLIWCIRDRSSISWIEEELGKAAGRLPAEALSIQIYVTGGDRVDTPTEVWCPSETVQPSKELNEKAAAGDDSNAVYSAVEIQYRRPFIPDVLKSTIRGGKMLFVGCGPEGMKTDLSNFVASSQKEVLKGKCVEIALHTETFDW